MSIRLIMAFFTIAPSLNFVFGSHEDLNVEEILIKFVNADDHLGAHHLEMLNLLSEAIELDPALFESLAARHWKNESVLAGIVNLFGSSKLADAKKIEFFDKVFTSNDFVDRPYLASRLLWHYRPAGYDEYYLSFVTEVPHPISLRTVGIMALGETSSDPEVLRILEEKERIWGSGGGAGAEFAGYAKQAASEIRKRIGVLSGSSTETPNDKVGLDESMTRLSTEGAASSTDSGEEKEESPREGFPLPLVLSLFAIAAIVAGIIYKIRK